MNTDNWHTNTSICTVKHPQINICSREYIADRKVFTLTSKHGSPVFKYQVNDSWKQYFHSAYNPDSEASQLIKEKHFDTESIICVLGAGYFYHISELLKKIPEQQPVIIIEKEEEIFLEALKSMNLEDILNREKLHLIVGEKSSEAANKITKIQMNESFKNICFLDHPPSCRVFKEYYNTVSEPFTVSEKHRIYDRLRYKKFNKSEINVLIFAPNYFLVSEISAAFDRLGYKYRLIDVKEEKRGTNNFIEQLIKQILDFQPDFLVTVNHLGLDGEGILSQFLEKIEMPFASWYVDNPNLIIKQYRKNISPYCTIFLWDKNNLSDMKELGYEHCFYMPLGVDEKRFKPLNNSQNPLFGLSSEVAFVGDSMVQKVRDSFEKTNETSCFSSLFHEIAMKYSDSSDRHISDFIKSEYPRLYDDYLKLNDIDIKNYETSINYEATKVYRLERVIRLLPFHPLIVGDKHWSELIDSRCYKYHPELSYYDELPYLYNVAKINFNATSRQMKGAVNQRVFDVPACSQFLLTDYQDQMEDLFKINEEMICYHDPDEIPDLVKYYLSHDSERNQIAKKGYNRVIKEHTYVARIKKMAETMRGIYQ